MPGLLDDTEAIVAWIAELSLDTYTNVMDQYRPDHKVLDTERYEPINRTVTSSEFKAGVEAARRAGLWRIDHRWRPMRRLRWV
jgi:putative pyruvate formate lyase activating enzyme